MRAQSKSSFIVAPFIVVVAALADARGQEATPTPAATGVDHRSVLLQWIDSWSAGLHLECGHETVTQKGKKRGRSGDAANLRIIQGVSLGGLSRTGDIQPWKTIDVIRTDRHEVLLSSRSLAPGVAIYDNGETRLVQTTFGRTHLDYEERAAHLLSLLDPKALREAVAGAKIESGVDPTGRLRVTAKIAKPKLFRPLRERTASRNDLLGWNVAARKILSLTMEVTFDTDRRLERLKFDVQHNDPQVGGRNMALGGEVIMFGGARGRIVVEDPAVADVGVVEAKQADADEDKKKDTPKPNAAKDEAKEKHPKDKPVEARVRRVVPAVRAPQAIRRLGNLLGGKPKAKAAKKKKDVPGTRDIYTLTPARKKSRRQTELLRNLRRAAGA